MSLNELAEKRLSQLNSSESAREIWKDLEAMETDQKREKATHAYIAWLLKDLRNTPTDDIVNTTRAVMRSSNIPTRFTEKSEAMNTFVDLVLAIQNDSLLSVRRVCEEIASQIPEEALYTSFATHFSDKEKGWRALVFLARVFRSRPITHVSKDWVRADHYRRVKILILESEKGDACIRILLKEFDLTEEKKRSTILGKIIKQENVRADHCPADTGEGCGFGGGCQQNPKNAVQCSWPSCKCRPSWCAVKGSGKVMKCIKTTAEWSACER